MAERMNIDIIATDRATPTLRRTRDEIDKVGQSARVTRDQTRNLGGSLGNLGRGAGQAGVQVQQFVGQVTGGVNPMIALSQQGADLGFVLGVPLLGAIVGISASIAAVLLPTLFKTEKAFADLAKEIKSVGLDINDLPAQVIDEQMKSLAQQVSEAKDSFKDANQEVKIARLEYELLRERLVRAGLSGEELNRALTEQRDNLEDTRKSLASTTAELLIAQKRQQNFKDEVNGTAEALERMAREQERVTNQMTERMRLIMEGASAEDKYLREVNKLRKALEDQNGELTPDALKAYQYHVEQLAKKYFPLQKSVKDVTDQFKLSQITMQEVEYKGIRSLEDALVDIGTGAKSAKEAFKDMARSILEDMLRMQIRGALMGIFQNGVSGAIGGMFGGYSGTPTSAPYQSTQQAFAVPDYAPADYRNLSFAGGGYTGMGGRSGGVDGQGGFPAILHPNETVVDHSKGQGGGVNVTLNISTGVSQTVRAEIANMLPQITQATKAAVADARMRGGSFSKAMVGA